MFAATSVGDAAFRGNMEAAKKDAEVAAAAMGLTIDMHGASTSRDIDAAFATMAEKRTEALLVNPSPLYFSRRVQIVSLAMRDRLPAIYPLREFAEVGGLMTYGTSQRDEYRKIGVFICRPHPQGGEAGRSPLWSSRRSSSSSSTNKQPGRSASTCRPCCSPAPTR